MRLAVTFLLQLTVTGAVFAWIFSRPGMTDGVVAGLRAADPVWLAAAVVAAGAGVLAQVCRWQIVLRMLQLRLLLPRTGAITLIGNFFNFFLVGAAGGDAARVLCVMREHPAQKTAALSSVIIDRMSGLFALALAAGLFTAANYERFATSPTSARMVWFLGAYILLAVLAVALCLAGGRIGLAGRLPLPHGLRTQMTKVDQAFGEASRQWKKSVAAVLVSLAVLFAYFTSFYCSSRAVGGRLDLGDVLAVMPVVDVLASIPVSVSGLGVREKSFEALLGTIAGVPAETAVLISLGGFAANLFWGLVGGLVFVFYRPAGGGCGLRWREVRDPAATKP